LNIEGITAADAVALYRLVVEKFVVLIHGNVS
jgi:hypothetical protein